MKTGTIKISKKIVIDRTTELTKAQEILEYSYKELIYQIKFHAPGFESWAQIIRNRPQSELPLLQSTFAAIRAEIPYLNWTLLDNFSDVLKIHRIPFVNYSFNIIEGNFHDINSFKIALIFITDELTLLGIIHDKLLLSFGDKTKELNNSEDIETFMLQIDDDIMISNFKSII